MQPTPRLIVFIVAGLLATAPPLLAQTTAEPNPQTPNWLTGHFDISFLRHDDVASSRFEEYRALQNGMLLPDLALQGDQNGKSFSLFARNVSRDDQRYTGRAAIGAFSAFVDFNSIPHNMGFSGHSIETPTAPGVWSMSQSLRQSLQTAVDSTPTAGRTFDFYSNLYAPTIADASLVNVSGLRQRGVAEVTFGKNLPFDLTMNYMREAKTGYRGPGGGYVRGAVDNIIEIPEPLNEVIQELSVRAAVNRNWGTVYGTFGRNWYNDRQETTVVDNPLRATDLLYVSASVPGGGSQARFINPPDNQAYTGTFGGLLKFAHQTRLGGNVTFGQWTQNAQLYPYTINSVILTGIATNGSAPAGSRADSLSSLQVQSLNGKIDTASANLFFSTRLLNHLGVRASFNLYDMNNKTPAFQRLGYVSLDRAWSTASFTTEPLGFPTADPYGWKSTRGSVAVNYNLKDVTFEGAYRYGTTDHTYREVEKNTDKAYTVSAFYRATDVVGVRAMFDKGTRAATGADVTPTLALQADQAARDATRAGVDVEVTPNGKLSFSVAYSRRKEDYKNPDQVAGTPGTAQGLLGAQYDSYTVDVTTTPSDRVELGAYYTYEKNLSTTQVFSGGTTLIGRLTFAGSDKTNTFGVNGRVVVVPDKWTIRLNARRQKLDGLMDIAGDPNGSFALARATLGGIADITAYGDTEITVASLAVECAVSRTWNVGVGYTYDKYFYADAFSDGTLVYPQTGTGFYLKANDHPYTANMLFTYMNYRW